MKVLILLACCLIYSVSAIGQTKQPRVYLDTKQFFAPTEGNFVEINFQFVAASISYKGSEGGLKAELAVLLDIVKSTDTLISDGFRLESPLMRDSIVEDFYDIRRFSLNPGTYELHLQIFDLIENGEPVKGKLTFTIVDKTNSISFGDIQNIEYAKKGDITSNFFKSGYEIIPRLSNFYPEQLTSLPYYTEIYNSGNLEIEEFGLKESLFDVDTKTELEDYTKFYRYKTNEIVPVLRQIDISELPTGNYYLSLAIIDQDMKSAKETKYYFERSNKDDFVLNDRLALDPAFEMSIPKDSVDFYLASLLPLASGETALQILNTLKEKNDEKSIKLIQAFWMATAKMTAYESWLKYKVQVLYVEKLFSNHFLRGYEADRGRVYLQYGAPTNVMARETSAAEFPYEIWQYDKIGRFSNKRFIFYNPDLIANNYRLLHSDLIGEVKNLNWSAALQQRGLPNGDPNDLNNSTPDYYGGQSNDLFRRN